LNMRSVAVLLFVAFLCPLVYSAAVSYQLAEIVLSSFPSVELA